MDIKEYELQTRFINENMDILQKYLIWKDFVSDEPQFINGDVKIEAEDVELLDEDWDDTDVN
jgi:hypothetical protein